MLKSLEFRVIWRGKCATASENAGLTRKIAALAARHGDLTAIISPKGEIIEVVLGRPQHIAKSSRVPNGGRVAPVVE